MTTFTEFNQAPDFGILAKYCGKSAKKKNGNANAALKTTMPIMGQNH